MSFKFNYAKKTLNILTKGSTYVDLKEVASYHILLLIYECCNQKFNTEQRKFGI